MQLSPALSSAPLARLEYVIRTPKTHAKATTIDAFVAAPEQATRVSGSFADAVRVAQQAAAAGTMDGMHRLPVNQAQAVVDAGDGAWLVAPVVGDHREAVGPIFIDGTFFQRAGLAVWAQRLDAGHDLHAIVGVDTLLDFRSHRPAATAIPISQILGAA